jgi:DnaJ-class molecular chaperone
LLAYYAEFSGDFETTSFEFTRCSTCAGTGVLETVEVSSQGAQNRRTQCPTCHGVGIRRALNFR